MNCIERYHVIPHIVYSIDHIYLPLLPYLISIPDNPDKKKSVLLSCYVFSRQGLTYWASPELLSRPGWPRLTRSTYLCLLNAGIKGVLHHPDSRETMSRIAQAGTVFSSLWVELRFVGLLCWGHRTEGCPDESFILPCCGRCRWGRREQWPCQRMPVRQFTVVPSLLPELVGLLPLMVVGESPLQHPFVLIT